MLTQDELGKKAGLSGYTISRIESDQVAPRVSTIRKIAGALGIEPEELAARPKEEYPPALEMPDERFEVLVREADESGLSEMMDDVGRYLPRRGEGRPSWRSVVAINRCVFIARERKARAAAELEKLEKLQIA